MFYNLVETQFSAKIKKLKTDNGGEYVNNEITAFLEMKGIIHNLSPLYIHESNGLPERMNRIIVTMVRSMSLACADVISQALCAEAYSRLYTLRTAYHIVLSNSKNRHTK
jgi:hypothetical protein